KERTKALIPLPSLDLLIPPKPSPAARGENLEARGKALMDCLNNFSVEGELVRITPGPVVTRYEVRPAPGIRVATIVKLSDDLTRALKASAIRIQAPVPGTDTVGIEIPNEHRETVNFRELASSEAFQKGCGPLTMILGKDITGRPYMADLTRMPHMLVAGATGAGKSVCLNSILASFLYRTQPSDLRLLLVDPKRIEMAVYADEPHLVHPVVTEMEDAKNALDWAVHEMEDRFKTLQRLGVRNIDGYNQKLASYHGRLPNEIAELEPLPYLVIVIDELADLMMTVRHEAEDRIVRLAQLARAAGIHMILATQRPSVDVVTGLIKANFPCRISFQVTSRHDSRTILDQEGAQHLLGRGDMLFKPASGPIQRLHGPFLSDEEVQAVVQHWKHYLTPTYKVDFTQWSPDAGDNRGATDGSDADDSLYGDVVNFVTEQGRASISLIQRRFKIGFNRSARLVEQLERDGIIGPADGSKPRLVKK
ncbi:MAG: DNA translocase FtsK, partial [Desulfovibrio sp.]|nr:DNA translocase FtsK [Desulfovibrio sp.]